MHSFISFALAFVLVCCSTVQAGQLLGSGQSAAPSCATGADHAIQTASDAAIELKLAARGQGFTPTANIKLYSIVLNIDTNPGSEVTGTLRWGTSTDLTSGYSESINFTIPSGTTGEFEIVSPGHLDMTSGTTYYFGFAAAGNTGLLFDYDTTSAVYAGGAFKHASSGWNMSEEIPQADMYFRIKACE
jgi:hypothetical protein